MKVGCDVAFGFVLQTLRIKAGGKTRLWRSPMRWLDIWYTFSEVIAVWVRPSEPEQGTRYVSRFESA